MAFFSELEQIDHSGHAKVEAFREKGISEKRKDNTTRK